MRIYIGYKKEVPLAITVVLYILQFIYNLTTKNTSSIKILTG